jgi:hypothetical protein
MVQTGGCGNFIYNTLMTEMYDLYGFIAIPFIFFFALLIVSSLVRERAS